MWPKKVWIRHDEKDWRLAEAAEEMDDGKLRCVVLDGNSTTNRKEEVVVQDHEQVFPANENVASDMTSLRYIHEPGILFNLEQRSKAERPYTFMGTILVSVNPLKQLPEPKSKVGIGQPHPYAIAELSYQQLCFASHQTRASNQSIVISGESGAGKSESCKRVLRHLVLRTSAVAHDIVAGKDAKTRGLDQRLMDASPILESLGNACTLCNHNSSRFGKFTKLHFDGSNNRLCGASIQTYLLERSRVTSHFEGERSFHVFYRLIAGADSLQRKKLGLPNSAKDHASFKFLRPLKQQKDALRRQRSSRHGNNNNGGEGTPSKPNFTGLCESQDFEAFQEFCEALQSIGIVEEKLEGLMRIIAGLLHLGNLEFRNDEKGTQGDVAYIVREHREPLSDITNSKVKDPMEWTCELFGVTEAMLHGLLCKKEMKVCGEIVMAKLSSQQAKNSRDAVAKAVYTRLFDWVIKEINGSINIGHGVSAEYVQDQAFIGVLDIFGFESFDVNSLEQLLINYTNEALQRTFNHQIFVAEAELYKHEGLVLQDELEFPELDSGRCMELLDGMNTRKLGLLGMIEAQTHSPQPSDEKLNQQLHRSFADHVCFPRPHPCEMSSTFIVHHFAGQVTYKMGQFVDKNCDSLPDKVRETFLGSSCQVVGGIFQADQGNAVGGINKDGVVKKFKSQIKGLTDTLDSTRCSFIRCIKPNPLMTPGLFDKGYVSRQLKCLSIPQTAQVLKAGLPTRIEYQEIVDAYKSALPRDTLEKWNSIPTRANDHKAFTRALFWALQVDPSCYRLGLTKVFFKSGMLDRLDDIMRQAKKWVHSSDSATCRQVSERFSLYYARLCWRRCFAKVATCNLFLRIYQKAKVRVRAADIIQACFLMWKPRRMFLARRMVARSMQARYRGAKVRVCYARQLARERESRIHLEREQQRERESRLRSEEEAKQRLEQETRERESLEQEGKDETARYSKELEEMNERLKQVLSCYDIQAKENQEMKKELEDLRQERDCAAQEKAELEREMLVMKKAHALLEQNLEFTQKLLINLSSKPNPSPDGYFADTTSSAVITTNIVVPSSSAVRDEDKLLRWNKYEEQPRIGDCLLWCVSKRK